MGKFGRLIEKLRKFLNSPAALGDFDDAAGEEADHFVEEAVACPSEPPTVILRFKRGAGKRAVVVGGLGFVAAFGGKGFEAVSSQGGLEGVFEEVGVELPGEVPGEAGFEW